MARFRLKLIGIIEETKDTKTFRFGLAANKFKFVPGQFVIANKMIDGKIIRRAYSISSSPFEKKHIELTIKKVENGIFSNYMHDNAKIGDIVDIDGPYGKFVYNDGNDDILLISAGCGVAPLMCIVRYVLEKRLDVNITLMHSCKKPNEMIFRKKFEELEANHKNFKYFPTITRPEGNDWSGTTGRINKNTLKKQIKNKNNVVVFVSGTISFGHSVVEMLREIGIGNERIKEEVY